MEVEEQERHAIKMREEENAMKSIWTSYAQDDCLLMDLKRIFFFE